MGPSGCRCTQSSVENFGKRIWETIAQDVIEPVPPARWRNTLPLTCGGCADAVLLNPHRAVSLIFPGSMERPAWRLRGVPSGYACPKIALDTLR